jgi:hypothetical protein
MERAERGDGTTLSERQGATAALHVSEPCMETALPSKTIQTFLTAPEKMSEPDEWTETGPVSEPDHRESASTRERSRMPDARHT